MMLTEVRLFWANAPAKQRCLAKTTKAQATVATFVDHKCHHGENGEDRFACPVPPSLTSLSFGHGPNRHICFRFFDDFASLISSSNSMIMTLNLVFSESMVVLLAGSKLMNSLLVKLSASEFCPLGIHLGSISNPRCLSCTANPITTIDSGVLARHEVVEHMGALSTWVLPKLSVLPVSRP